MKPTTFATLLLLLAIAALPLIALSPPAMADFGFDEMEQIDSAEQDDLLSEAKKAARSWSFGTAESYLKQAEQKGFAPNKVKAVRDLISSARNAKAAKERREEEERQLAQRQRREREASRRASSARRDQRDASGNMGGTLPCHRVSKDYGLWNYCKTGDCSGLSKNYGIWNLCKNNDPSGLSGNFGVWSYLKTGNTSGLSKNYRAWRGAKKNAGSFADRKRWVIFYLRGYIYGYR